MEKIHLSFKLRKLTAFKSKQRGVMWEFLPPSPQLPHFLLKLVDWWRINHPNKWASRAQWHPPRSDSRGPTTRWHSSRKCPKTCTISKFPKKTAACSLLHPIIHKGRIITASRGFVNIPASCALNADRAKLKSRAVSPGHSLAADSTNLLAIQVQVLPSQTHTVLPATHPRGRSAATTTINVRSSSFKGPL